MNPVLFLLMRNDIPSMNPGKLAAQACHVGQQFVDRIHQIPSDSPIITLYNTWLEDRAFGTTITLGANRGFFTTFNADSYYKGLGDVVFDPTYPCSIPLEVAEHLDIVPGIIDRVHINRETGKAVYLRNELVGGYLFGDKEDLDLTKIINGLELYP